MKNFGTLESSRLSKDEIKSLASSFCSLETITTVEGIDAGVNTSVKVTDDTTQSAFIKFGTFQRDDAVFQIQPLVLAFLAENDFEHFQTTTPIGYDYTKNDTHYDYYVTEWIDDSTFIDVETIEADETDVDSSVAQTVGKVLAEINSIDTDGYGEPRLQVDSQEACTIDTPPQFADDSWSDFYTRYLQQLLYNTAPRFYEFVDELDGSLDGHTVRESPSQLLHLDYWWENLLWNGDTPYVIDWERAVGGDPLLNKYLSQHYLFDTIAMPEEAYMEDRQAYITQFNDAYDATYDGTVSLSADAETEILYKLLPLFRELRAFPYWWREKDDEWKDYRHEQLTRRIRALVARL